MPCSHDGHTHTTDLFHSHFKDVNSTKTTDNVKVAVIAMIIFKA